jgi:hypothetical protein
MRKPWQTGVLAISVDLEAFHRAQLEASRRGRDTVARLLDLFARHRLPATWAIGNPALAAHSEVLAIGPHHELALRGEAAWTCRRAGRLHLAMDLPRRLGAAREAGIGISSLALDGGTAMAGPAIATLVEAGITAVWNTAADRSGRDKAVKLGPDLWQLPVTAIVPARDRWLPRAPGELRQAIRRATEQCDIVHLAVDAARLEQASALAAVNASLRLIAATREKGEIAVTTLARIAADLSQTTQSAPSRSILRVA